MITFNPEDRTVDVEEIEQIMDAYDNNGSFSTRLQYQKNYYAHYINLIGNGHVMTFRDNYNKHLRGFCAWILVDKETKKDINKVRWTLPVAINNGNILYIDTCLTTSTAMIYTIKKNLTSRFKDKVDEVCWVNVGKGRFFQKVIKGGVPCKTAV